MRVAVKSTTTGDTESTHLLPPTTKPPHDSFHLAYLVYFTLGFGFLLPWNAFITAVDYFAYLYPDASVDRIFAVVYMLVGLVCLGFITFYARVSDAYVRINVGLGVFVLSLLVVPVMDLVYVKGEVGLYSGFYVTAVAVAVALSGVGDALVQSGIVGNAGELPERYMQATIAGTAASGKLFKFVFFFYMNCCINILTVLKMIDILVSKLWPVVEEVEFGSWSCNWALKFDRGASWFMKWQCCAGVLMMMIGVLVFELWLNLVCWVSGLF